jgi:hypothetical protein
MDQSGMYLDGKHHWIGFGLKASLDWIWMESITGLDLD